MGVVGSGERFWVCSAPIATITSGDARGSILTSVLGNQDCAGRSKMVLTKYERGRAYEYRIAKKLRAEGWTVLRMAGSHGFADLVAIEQAIQFPNEFRRIKLIQAKSGKSSKRAIKKVLDSDIKRFEGLYSVSVEVL